MASKTGIAASNRYFMGLESPEDGSCSAEVAAFFSFGDSDSSCEVEGLLLLFEETEPFTGSSGF